MSLPRTTLGPDNQSLYEAYQRILAHDPTKWDLYPHLAALLPTGVQQSHVYLQGAWRALDRGEYSDAQKLATRAAEVYGKTFRSRQIEIELLKRQGKAAAIPKKLLEIAETFKQHNLPAQEVKAYKCLAQLDPNPAYYQRVMILYTQINKVQKAAEWASRLAQIAPPRPVPSAPLPPKPAHREAAETKQPNPIDKQITASNPVRVPDIAFGKDLWARYFGDVGAEPPLPPDIEQILNSSCPFWPDKKVRETHMLVLVPETVTIKGGGFLFGDKTIRLNLKTLGELIQKPLQGQATKYRGFYLGEYTDPAAPKSHWALLTRDVLSGSRSKSYPDQQAQVEDFRQKTNLPYEIPTILDATVCIFMEYFRTGKRLYSDDPYTVTRCQEKFDSNWQLAVGGFAPAGLLIYFNYDLDYSGVGVLRKFF